MLISIRKLIRFLSNEKGEGDSFRSMNVSLNMLLLAFFIALNSMAVQDDARVRKALGSLIGSFGILPGGVNPFARGGSQMNLPGDVPMVPIESMQSFLNSIEKYALTRGFGKGFGVNKEGDYFVMRMTDDILFVTNEITLKKEILYLLNEISEFLNTMSGEIRIVGHTDDSEPVDEYSSNWSFSSAKALSLMHYMIEKAHISPKRISVVGYGDARPMFPNDTENHRGRNRRIEILFKEA